MESKPDMYLSNRGYIIKKHSLTHSQEVKLRKDLTVSPFQISGFSNISPPKFPVFLENQSKYYLPRFYGVRVFGVPKTNYLENSGDDIDIAFNGSLRPHQLPIVEEMIKALNIDGGGILNLRCGLGKTILALHIISRMKKKALIVVHKEFLMNQWLERLNEFLPDARIGIIQQKKVQVQDCDIVIGMLQSLAMRNYDNSVFDSFGMTVIDECHHISSEVFSRSLPKISTKYMLGLSATLDRKDGLRKVFEWYLGPPVVSISKIDNVGEVRVYVVPVTDPRYQQTSLNISGQVNLPRIINNVVQSPKRMKIVLEWMDFFSKNDRKILVLSERREHLKSIEKHAKELNLDCGFYWGGMNQEKLKQSESKQILLGTYHMISEGFDLSSLDSLIFASPKADIVQASGRILRQGKDRPTIPIIVDIEDNMEYLKKKCRTRIKYYKKNDFKVAYCENPKLEYLK